MKNSIINKNGYKKTSLGWIPEDWEVLKLIQLGTFAKGKGILRDQLVEQGLPCVRYGEIYTTYNYYVKQFTSFIDTETAKESKEIKSGDILFAGSGETLEDIGKAIAYVGEEKAYAGGDIIIFTPAKKIDITYLSFSLNMPYAVRQKSKLGQGNSIVHLYPKNVGELEIFIPSDKEQQKISNILVLWDNQIEKTKKLISAKEKLKKGLMQQLLTGKKRLKGFDGQWKKVSAGEIFKGCSKKGFENEELLSATQDCGIIPRTLLNGNVTMPSGDRKSFKLVEKGDFVISLRSFQGGLEYSYYKGIVSPAYTVLKPKVKISDEFYKYYFKSYDFIGHLATAVIGIRDGKQISYEDFCMVKIPSIDYKEQIAISNVLLKLDSEIQLLNSKLEKLNGQKKGLMQVLLTGKVRVKI